MENAEQFRPQFFTQVQSLVTRSGVDSDLGESHQGRSGGVKDNVGGLRQL